jgi:hypothetical protein
MYQVLSEHQHEHEHMHMSAGPVDEKQNALTSPENNIVCCSLSGPAMLYALCDHIDVKPPVNTAKTIANGARTARPIPPPNPHMVSTKRQPRDELSAMAEEAFIRCRSARQCCLIRFPQFSPGQCLREISEIS